MTAATTRPAPATCYCRMQGTFPVIAFPVLFRSPLLPTTRLVGQLGMARMNTSGALPQRPVTITAFAIASCLRAPQRTSKGLHFLNTL